MARIKYYYDTETCKYERIKTRTSDVIFNFMGFGLLSLLFGAAIYIVFNTYFESPQVLSLKNEVEELKYQIETMEDDLDQLDRIASALEYRDNNIYRVIMGVEDIHPDIRNAGIGGSDRYEKLMNSQIENKQLIMDTRKRIDKIKRKYFIQVQSYDDLDELIADKEQMLASIPAIQPIANQELIRLASGYGRRIHPVYKVRKMHWGIDFSAPIGTPVYATADGKVTLVEVSFRGYGKQMEIDHGFGFKTKYAHLHDFAVKRGQEVKRGELIAYVGNSGLSTAPHLHYEVYRNGRKVNPVHYFFNDLTPEEYEKVVELASIENQSLGM